MITIKNATKDPKKKHVKDIRIFLKKKKIKGKQMIENDINILLKKEKKRRQYHQEPKKKLPDNRRYYYLACEK